MGIFSLEDRYKFLALDFPHEIDLDGIKYPNALRAFAGIRFTQDSWKQTCVDCDDETIDYFITTAMDGELIENNFRRRMQQCLYRILDIKFSDPVLREKLKALEGEVIIVLGTNLLLNRNKGRGENMLGKTLMRLRDDIIAKDKVNS